jgi:MFS transporter, DHA1 family, multidrug resistance protein
MDIIRESTIGVLIRSLQPNCLPYLEEDNALLQESGKILHLETSSQKGPVLCEWDGQEDPGNPVNWKPCKKALVLTNIVCYALVVYMSAPIWTPGEEMFRREFGGSYESTVLGLALYMYVSAGPTHWMCYTC